jgi:hypothetical protein
MKNNFSTNEDEAPLTIRIYLADGTTESFVQHDESQARKICEKLDYQRLFAQPRLIIAGEHFKSVFVTSHVVRVDVQHKSLDRWEFPAGYADVVSLSEEEFRAHAHLDEPEKMMRREDCTPVGDLLVSFLDLRMAGGAHFYLMTEFPVKLSVDNQFFVRFLLSKVSIPARLTCGGVAVINLANLISYNVFPGVAEVPADTWIAEHSTKHRRA